MQEKFVLKAKTAIKRVAAMSTGALMLGATALGAVAAYDLGDYPAPFVSAGTWGGLVVVGSGANAADIVGATDIIGRLTQESVSPVSGTGAILVTGGISGKALFGEGIANSSVSDAIDYELEDDDISTLVDTSITFQSTEYDVREMVVLDQDNPVIETSLTGSDDDYETTPYMEVKRGGIAYYYIFDKSINIAGTNSTDGYLQIDFLGKTLKITETDTDGKGFTAQVGSEYFMNVGDSVTVEGKDVKLLNVGSTGSVVVQVGGPEFKEALSTTETINGIEITVDEYFYSDITAERSATLIIGAEASASYDDGDEYPDYCGTKWKSNTCKKTDPDWVWVISELNATGIGDATAAATTGASPTIGVKNDFVVNGDDDNPVTVGGCYDLPNGFLEICFDSLTTTDYLDLRIEYEPDVDLTDHVAGNDSVDTIYMTSSEEDTIEIQTTVEGVSTAIKTDKIWMWLNLSKDNNNTEIFYEDADNDMQYAGFLQTDLEVVNASVFRIIYGATKSTNIEVDFNISNKSADNFNMTFNIIDDDSDMNDAADDIRISWGHTAINDVAGKFDGLGSTAATNEAGELYWAATTDISTKDEDHMTQYGIIIKDPKSNGGSDEVYLQIPSDLVRGNIIVKGSGSTVSTAGGSVQINTIAGVDLIKLDTEVTDKTSKPLIIVGGPCINPLAAEAMFGSPAAKCGTSSTIPQNKAIIQLIENAFGGTNVALVVAGWEAANTREAANILKDYSTYLAQLSGKTKVQVSGTSVTAVSDTSTVA